MGKWDFLRPYDTQVHDALAAGDLSQAFEVLLQGYQSVVVQYCGALLGNAADGEDVAQTVFEAVWRTLPRYQPTALLRTWIFRIARNQCGKHQGRLALWGRRLLAHRGAITVTAVPDAPLPPDRQHQEAEEQVQHQHQVLRLERSLRRLPQGERALLMMYYHEELSFRAMAQQLRLPEATVRRAVHAAEERLRGLMIREERRDER